MTQKLGGKWILYFPLLLLLVNIFLKWIFIDNQDICLDEPFSIYHAQFDIDQIPTILKPYNNPPLFEIILHIWMKIFGFSPTAVRALPLIFASLSPVALFYFTKRNFSIAIAIASSLLLTFSSLLFYYAHDCRMYSLFMLLGILSMHCFLELLRINPPFRIYIAYITIGIFTLYAHYFGAIILFIQFIFLLLYHRQKLFQVVGCWLTMGVLYIPQLQVVVHRMQVSIKGGTWIEKPNGFESLYNMFWSFSNIPLVTVICLCIIIVAALFALSGKRNKLSSDADKLIRIWFFLPFFGMFLFSYAVPVYISRYLTFALPAYYVLICRLLEFTLIDKLKYVALGSLTLLFVISVNLNPDKKRPIRDAVRLLTQLQDSNTVVVVNPKDLIPTFAYHYGQNYFREITDEREYAASEKIFRDHKIQFINNAVEFSNLTLNQFAKVIIFSSESQANRDEVIDCAKRSYSLSFEKSFNGYFFIYVFTNPHYLP